MPLLTEVSKMVLSDWIYNKKRSKRAETQVHCSTVTLNTVHSLEPCGDVQHSTIYFIRLILPWDLCRLPLSLSSILSRL